MGAYMGAKAHIFLNQRPEDICVFGYDDPGSNALADQAPGRVAWFSLREMIPDGAFMAGHRLMGVGSGSPDGQPPVVCAREDIRLRGQHNIRNVLAGCALAGAARGPLDGMRDAL